MKNGDLRYSMNIHSISSRHRKAVTINANKQNYTNLSPLSRTALKYKKKNVKR